MKVVVFIGPPGSGKGTLAQLCMKHLGWEHVSFGNLLRQEVLAQTELGKRIEAIISKGNLMDDETVVRLIDNVLNQHTGADAAQGIILDGVPRTVVQAASLYKIVEEKSADDKHLVVVKMSIDDKKIVNRLTSRMICSNKSCQKVYSLNDSQLRPRAEGLCDVCEGALMTRSDDTPESIGRRVAIYREHECQLMDYYQARKFPIHLVYADQPIQAVFQEFLAVLGVTSSNT